LRPCFSAPPGEDGAMLPFAATLRPGCRLGVGPRSGGRAVPAFGPAFPESASLQWLGGILPQASAARKMKTRMKTRMETGTGARAKYRPACRPRSPEPGPALLPPSDAGGESGEGNQAEGITPASRLHHSAAYFAPGVPGGQ